MFIDVWNEVLYHHSTSDNQDTHFLGLLSFNILVYYLDDICTLVIGF